jgi:D-serine deaminase-like pyridoxal phosphate-dependent protein
MLKREIDTQALLLDLDVVEENIRTMAAFFADRPQKLRPHFKTPKTPEVARRQLLIPA